MHSTVTALFILVMSAAPSGAQPAGGYAADKVRPIPASALKTPNGSSWIVLPRPPARSSSIYTDGWVAPFSRAGTGFTTTAVARPRMEGTSSLSVTIRNAGAWFEAQVNPAEQAFSGAGQTELTFAFNAGASVHAGVASLAVAVEDDDAATPTTWVPLTPYLAAGTVEAKTWYKVLIPMSALNPSGHAIRRVLIGNSTHTNVDFYLDDVALSWTDPNPAETIVYADAPGTSFIIDGWGSTTAPSAFRTTGADAIKGEYNEPWNAVTFTWNWSRPEFPAGTHTTVSFDISGGSDSVPPAMNDMLIGLGGVPTKKLISYIPGGLQPNAWHRVTLRTSDLVTGSYRQVMFKNETAALYSFYVDEIRFQVDRTPPPLREARTTGPRGRDPDSFVAGEVDVVTNVKTAEDRAAISPLIYGLNGSGNEPSDVLRGVSFVRRGGDRGNTYNWETNVSNGGHWNTFSSDLYLVKDLSNPNAPAAVDLDLIARNRAAGRGTMVPFVLNDYVAGPVASRIPYDRSDWDRDFYFKRVGLVKPTPFTSDGIVYTDEHIDYLRFHPAQLTRVEAWRVDALHPDPFLASSQELSKYNALICEAPAHSATLLVFNTREPPELDGVK
jgi:hypothetical protein